MRVLWKSGCTRVGTAGGGAASGQGAVRPGPAHAAAPVAAARAHINQWPVFRRHRSGGWARRPRLPTLAAGHAHGAHQDALALPGPLDPEPGQHGG
jgi:hypothetical protein